MGASLWKRGTLMSVDPFASTLVRPEWIDHEREAEVLFYGMLTVFGCWSLMGFKIAAACEALLICAATSQVKHSGWPAILTLAVPSALTVLPGYVTVVRSHAVTYMFCAATLLCLELIRKGRRWPSVVIILTMLFWVNNQGGAVTALVATVVYDLVAVMTRTMAVTMLATPLASLAPRAVLRLGSRCLLCAVS